MCEDGNEIKISKNKNKNKIGIASAPHRTTQAKPHKCSGTKVMEPGWHTTFWISIPTYSSEFTCISTKNTNRQCDDFLQAGKNDIESMNHIQFTHHIFYKGLMKSFYWASWSRKKVTLFFALYCKKSLSWILWKSSHFMYCFNLMENWMGAQTLSLRFQGFFSRNAITQNMPLACSLSLKNVGLLNTAPDIINIY